MEWVGGGVGLEVIKVESFLVGSGGLPPEKLKIINMKWYILRHILCYKLDIRTIIGSKHKVALISALDFLCGVER